MLLNIPIPYSVINLRNYSRVDVVAVWLFWVFRVVDYIEGQIRKVYCKNYLLINNLICGKILIVATTAAVVKISS